MQYNPQIMKVDMCLDLFQGQDYERYQSIGIIM